MTRLHKIALTLSLVLVAIVSGAWVIKETKQDENLSFYVNRGGTVSESMRIAGASGAVTLGPTGVSSASLIHTVNLPNSGSAAPALSTSQAFVAFGNGSSGNSLPYIILNSKQAAGSAGGGVYVTAAVHDANTNPDLTFNTALNTGGSFAAAGTAAYSWQVGGSAIGSATRAGAFTLGPSGASATLEHSIFGHLKIGTSAASVSPNSTAYRLFGNKKAQLIFADSATTEATFASGVYFDGASYKVSTTNRSGGYLNIASGATLGAQIFVFGVNSSVSSAADSAASVQNVGGIDGNGSWTIGPNTAGATLTLQKTNNAPALKFTGSAGNSWTLENDAGVLNFYNDGNSIVSSLGQSGALTASSVSTKSGVSGSIANGNTFVTLNNSDIPASSIWELRVYADTASAGEYGVYYVHRPSSGIYFVRSISGGLPAGIDGSNNLAITNNSGGTRVFGWSALRLK